MKWSRPLGDHQWRHKGVKRMDCGRWHPWQSTLWSVNLRLLSLWLVTLWLFVSGCHYWLSPLSVVLWGCCHSQQLQLHSNLIVICTHWDKPHKLCVHVMPLCLPFTMYMYLWKRAMSEKNSSWKLEVSFDVCVKLTLTVHLFMASKLAVIKIALSSTG